jgi:hypothetical protein
VQFLTALVVSLAITSIWQAPASKLDSFKNPENLTDEQNFRNYSVRIYREEIGLGGVEILKDGKRLWSDAEGQVYTVGHVYEQIPGAIDLRIGTDITGDGLRDLVISAAYPTNSRSRTEDDHGDLPSLNRGEYFLKDFHEAFDTLSSWDDLDLLETETAEAFAEFQLDARLSVQPLESTKSPPGLIGHSGDDGSDPAAAVD